MENARNNDVEESLRKLSSLFKDDGPNEWIGIDIQKGEEFLHLSLASEDRFHYVEAVDLLMTRFPVLKELANSQIEEMVSSIIQAHLNNQSITNAIQVVVEEIKGLKNEMFYTFKPLWESVKVSRWESGNIKVLSIEEFKKDVAGLGELGTSILGSLVNVLDVSHLGTSTFVSYQGKCKRPEKFLEDSKKVFITFENIVRYLEGPFSYTHFSMFHRQAPRVWGELHVSKDTSGWTAEGNISKGSINLEKLLNQTKEFELLMNFATQKEEPNKYQERIFRAASTLGSAYLEKDDDNAFLKAIMALESLFTSSSNELLTPSITEQLSTTVSYILSEELEERRRIFRMLKKSYSTRSKVVHGGGAHVDRDTFISVALIIDSVIKQLLTREDLKNLTTYEELQEWVQDKKLS